MKKWFIIALLIAPFVYANNKKPPFINHQQIIYQAAAGQDKAIDEAVYELPQWQELEYVDWKFVTATRDKNKQSLVSFGIVSYLKVVDTEWGPKAFGIKPERAADGTK